MIDASVSRTPTRKFHIIQPVVVNQNTRSPGCASRCRCIFFSCSTRMPPCEWTIALGSPVVPDEYKIQSGSEKSTGTKSKSLTEGGQSTLSPPGSESLTGWGQSPLSPSFLPANPDQPVPSA